MIALHKCQNLYPLYLINDDYMYQFDHVGIISFLYNMYYSVKLVQGK